MWELSCSLGYGIDREDDYPGGMSYTFFWNMH